MKNPSKTKKHLPSSRLMYHYPTSTVPAAVPVATSTVSNTSNSSSHRRIATPSRRRRIIYETARRLTRQYINDAIHTIHCTTNASERIQRQWRNYRSKVRYHNAILQIQGLLRIYQAKLETNQRRHHQKASQVITSFFCSCHLYQLSRRAATIMIQKHWRGVTARNVLQEYKLSILEMECSAIVIQSFVRSYIAKVAYQNRHFPPNAIIVQRWFRVYQAKKRKREMKKREKKRMVEASYKVQYWWKRIMVAKRLIVYAMEETIRLRMAAAASAAEEKDGDETDNDDLNSQDELGSDTSSVSDNDDGGDNVDDLLPPFPNELESDDDENDPSLLNDDDEIKSNSTSCDLNDDQLFNDNSNLNDDEASTSTLQSSMSNDESAQRYKKEMMELLLVEMKHYQAACRIQHHAKIYIHHQQYLREQQLEKERQRQEQLKQQQEAERRRKQQIEQERLQKISIAAMVLTRQLWMLYQSFLKRRFERKREMEIQAATLIQTYIRSFLATRYVQDLREATYEHILNVYYSEFFYGQQTQKQQGQEEADDDWFLNMELPCFLTTFCENGGDYSNDTGNDKFFDNDTKYNEDLYNDGEEGDKENIQHSKEQQQQQQADTSTSQSTSFHDEWVAALPPESKKLIPPGCNLYGIDLNDKDSLIRCLTLKVRDDVESPAGNNQDKE